MQEIIKAVAFYPKFPDGRVDYTNERVCCVLNCVVIAGDKALLTRRGENVLAYPNTMNGISGFIDDTNKDIEQLAKEELAEEIHAPLHKLKHLIISQPFVQVDDEINRA